jgi:uncharacterized protein
MLVKQAHAATISAIAASGMCAGRVTRHFSRRGFGPPAAARDARESAKAPIMPTARSVRRKGRRASHRSYPGENMAAKRSGLIAVALLASALCFGVGTASAQSQQSAAQRNRVVIQVSDAEPAKWNLALNNARNIQTDLGPANVDIEIIAYGPGIGMLKSDSVVGNRVEEAGKAGVKLIACQNTMRGQKLTQADMLSDIGYVPAGVVTLMQRQQQGWAYIRP